MPLYNEPTKYVICKKCDDNGRTFAMPQSKHEILHSHSPVNLSWLRASTIRIDDQHGIDGMVFCQA